MIPFSVGRRGLVELGVYDLRGRLVRQLVSGLMAEGSYSEQWNGRNGAESTMPAGVYLVRIKLDAVQEIKKISLVKYGTQGSMAMRHPQLVLCISLALATIALGNTQPEVTNVAAVQRPHTALVDVTYDLFDADGDAMHVMLWYSLDGGEPRRDCRRHYELSLTTQTGIAWPAYHIHMNSCEETRPQGIPDQFATDLC